jgi:hypothetical protein
MQDCRCQDVRFRSVRCGWSRPCRVSELTRVVYASEDSASVLEFVTAFNAGEQQRLNRVFADAPMFKWYSVTRSVPYDHFVAHSKAALLPYFARRHARNEGHAIMHFRYGGISRAPVGSRSYLVGNFSYRLLRWADDIGDGRPELYVGKGVVSCTSLGARLMVWSMGTPSSSRTGASGTQLSLDQQQHASNERETPSNAGDQP